MNLKEILGALTMALTLIGYAPYLWGAAKGVIRPHLFSWIIWALVNGIAFAAQVVSHAGPGAWFTGLTGLICLAIVFIAGRAEKDITRIDVVALVGGLAAIPVWYFTANPLWAVVMAALIDLIGTIPTIRKSWKHPEHEALFMWGMAAARPWLSILALESLSPTTVIFPVAQSLNNLVVIAVVAWRRHGLAPDELSTAFGVIPSDLPGDRHADEHADT